MEAFLLNWGTELLFALLAAGVTGFFKWKSSKLKKKLDDYETMVNDQTAQKNEEMMESKLEPIYQELEDLRAYIRETQNIEKAHMALIIASYRFRLVQLCKQFIKQGYITTSQYEQLSEFYKLYVGLGGNGSAKEWHDKAVQLQMRDDD